MTAQRSATPLFVSSGDLIADRRYEFARDLAARGDLAGLPFPRFMMSASWQTRTS